MKKACRGRNSIQSWHPIQLVSSTATHLCQQSGAVWREDDNTYDFHVALYWLSSERRLYWLFSERRWQCLLFRRVCPGAGRHCWAAESASAVKPYFRPTFFVQDQSDCTRTLGFCDNIVETGWINKFGQSNEAHQVASNWILLNPYTAASVNKPDV